MSDFEKMVAALSDDSEGLTDKQKKIIVAAIEYFSEKGFSATSTSEIAKKAGVAEGTIFRHYKTKKELLLSIVTPVITKLIAPFVIQDFKKVLDQQFETYEDFLKATIRNRRDFLQNHLPILRILLQEIPFHPELREQFKEHVATKLFERIAEITKHFQEKGQIIEMPTYSVVRLTVTTIFGFLLARYLFVPEANWDDEAEIERTIQFIMHGIAVKEVPS